jgi:hypothetical protein
MKKILYVLVIILGLLISYPFIKPPNVYIYREQHEIILENIFLGEYYLGFNKLKIQSIQNHTLLCEIEHPHMLYPEDQQQIRLKKGINDELSIWGSAFQHPTAKPCLLKNETYIVSVWGNNGSGFSTRKRLKITIP